MKQKVVYPFDVAKFRRDNRLTILTFALAIGKDIKRAEDLESGKAAGLTSHEHSSLCRQFGRGRVVVCYDLTPYATEC